MKSLSKKIILISLSLILIGIIFTTIGMFLGGRSGISISRTGIRSVSEEPDSYELTKTKLDNFSNADLTLSYGDIYILPSEDENYYLEYELYGSGGKPSYDVVNDKFSITQKDTDFTFMMFGFSSSETVNSESYIRLYVPKNKELKTLTLYGYSGSINLNDIHAKDVTLDIAYGEVNIKDSLFTSLSLTSNSAEFKLNDSEMKNFNLDGEYGEVSMKNFICDSASIILESSDIVLDASALNHLDYHNEYGSLTLKLPETLDTYSFDVALEYGEIELPDDAPSGLSTIDDSQKIYQTKGKGTQTIKIKSESEEIRIENR